ncbi:MAG: SDR family oxidoreductase [Thermoplasmata archaeon]|nr:SDR family oxidoreductase [Thermoplasmata archaeon]
MEIGGRVAIITGAASGIGRATALRLAKDGAKIVVADIDKEWAAETVRLVEKAGGEAMFVPTDVTKESDAVRCVEQAVKRFGRVDILVNNAGIALVAKITETTEAQWDKILDTNLKGAFLMSKHVIPQFLSQGRGAIVNTASDAGVVGFANLGAYCASKGGIIQLTRALALEYGGNNIRVNAVAPTSTLHTRMLDGLFKSVKDPEALHKALAKSHPLNRLGTAEEVAELMYFLASDRASYITGGVFPVDGGITAACPVAEF